MKYTESETVELKKSTAELKEAIINAFCHRDYWGGDSVDIAIFKDCKDTRITVTFTYIGENFFVEMNDTTQKTTQKTTQNQLNAVQLHILSLLKDDPSITRGEIAKKIGTITSDGVKYHLNLLQKNKIIKRTGGRKQGVWNILKVKP